MASPQKKRRTIQRRRPKNENACEDKIAWAPGFRLPKERDIQRALGIKCSDLIPNIFEPSVHFEQLPFPTAEKDWLANINEPGQSYLQFMSSCPWLQKNKVKRYQGIFNSSGNNILEKYPDGKIYILNIEDSDFKESENVIIDDESLKEYLEIYYGIPVCFLPKKMLVYDKNNDMTVLSGQGTETLLDTTFRKDKDTGHIQMRIDTGLLDVKTILPDDCLFLVVVTLIDLYGDQTDLFTMGTGSVKDRLGIFSFKRYDPCFNQHSEENWYDYDISASSYCSKIRKNLIFQRSCKTLIHEVGHLLGIKHCIYYSCAMNGSGHLQEDFRQPIHMCPIDLHKILSLTGMDVKERYSKLADFYSTHEMSFENCWVKSRMQYIDK